MFLELQSTLSGNVVTCANNSSYPIIGVEKIKLIATNGGNITLLDALYIPGIKRNFLLVATFTKANSLSN